MGASSLGSDIGGGKFRDHLGNTFVDLEQGYYDWLPAEWRVAPKCHVDYGVNICLPLEGLPIAAFVFDLGFDGIAIKDIAIRDNRNLISNFWGWPSSSIWQKLWIKVVNLLRSESGKASNRNNQLVLVGNIQGMKPTQKYVAARMRFQPFNYLDDIFAGEIGISIRDGALKAFGPLRKGKLDAFGLRGFVANHSEHEQIQSGSHVVNCITNSECEIVWNCRLGFDTNNALTELWIMLNNEMHRLPADVVSELPMNVTDVILGPLDF